MIGQRSRRSMRSNSMTPMMIRTLTVVRSKRRTMTCGTRRTRQACMMSCELGTACPRQTPVKQCGRKDQNREIHMFVGRRHRYWRAQGTPWSAGCVTGLGCIQGDRLVRS